MKTLRTLKQSACLGLAVAAVSALCVCGVAQAQRGGPQLSDEDAQSAWRTQAIGVMRELGVERESGGSEAVAAYIEARKSHKEARDKLSTEGDRRSNFQAYLDLNETEREKLSAALKEILSEEQTTKIMPYLGTFSGGWDGMTHTLLSFELDRETQRPLAKLMNAYIAAYGKAIEEARESRSFESMRTAMTEIKETLDTGLAEHLSEEQLAKWKEATVFRRR